jgi:membrane protein DedA with SNARE-associated domain
MATGMEQLIHYLLRHGYLFLFLFVFAEQIGFPLPALPVLLGMGALIGLGYFSFPAALLAAFVATMAADLTWYALGRRKGHAIVHLMCRISLEPDICVRRMTGVFDRFGNCALLLAKFIPGVSMLAPPLAGAARMSPLRFATCDAAGTVLWAGSFLGLGYLFHDQMGTLAAWAAQLGYSFLVLLVAPALAWIAGKYWHRRRFLRQLAADRITPEELHAKLQAGEPLLVVDLRHAYEIEQEPATLPGAVQIAPDELESRHQELPRDRDIVLFCT